MSEGNRVIVIGSGPIAAAPACRALRTAGLRVIVVDPDPASIVIDAEFADAGYPAPITPAGLAAVLAVQRPDGLLPILGGRTAMTAAAVLDEDGVLRRYGTTLLGMDAATHRRLTDRTANPWPADGRDGSVIDGSVIDVDLMVDAHGEVTVLGTVERVDVGPLTVTVTPAPSVSDPEYRALRHAAAAVLPVAAPGAGSRTVRFVLHRDRARFCWQVRDVGYGPTAASAFVAARTGFPVAELAARLAVGLDPAVTAPEDDRVLVALDTAIGIGADRPAALNAALRAAGQEFWGTTAPPPWLAEPEDELRHGADPADVAARTGLPSWLVDAVDRIGRVRTRIEAAPVLDADVLIPARRVGLGDGQVAALRPEIADGAGVRRVRERLAARETPTDHTSNRPTSYRSTGPTVLLLTSPGYENVCAGGAIALRRAGFRVAVLGVGIGGPTVADHVHPAPQGFEDAVDAVHAERRAGAFVGVVSQLGGPDAVALGAELAAAGVTVLGQPEPIEVTGGITGTDGPPVGGTALDVLACYDGTDVYVGAVAEALDPHGTRWPESGYAIPAPSVGPRTMAVIRRRVQRLARRHGVPGLLDVRLAVLPDAVVVCSATVGATPNLAFASAATGVDLAQIGARLVLGATIGQLVGEGLVPATESDIPVTVRLTTAEHAVLGSGTTLGAAFGQARAAAGAELPTEGTVLVSVGERHLRTIAAPARELAELGLRVLADPTTAHALRYYGVECATVHTRPDADLVLTVDGESTTEPGHLHTTGTVAAAVAAIAAHRDAAPREALACPARAAPTPPRSHTG